ncbi:ly6/PLAUR domain-containing protein 2-like [Rhinatrema bivittatum]|uniref:ly6/PLAUR domain-containing protein 2-like n=1 Tax=Rhinatrema bivittatum TaxID=194408 RepID=UPI0011286CBD|nr:ly6/PLAUR domain-containing protein 2-like [Rhinatrema bivittatum]
MKAFPVLVWVAPLFIELAGSLQCYTCQSPTPSLLCTNIRNCTSTQTACKTFIYETGVGFPFHDDKSIITYCAEECIPTNLDWFAVRRPILCCSSDLCNQPSIRSGAISVHLGCLAAAATSLLSTLLRPGPFL